MANIASSIFHRRYYVRLSLENQQKFINLINNSNDGITIFDHDGKYILWNKGMEKIIGPSQEDMLGKTVKELFISIPGLELSNDEINNIHTSIVNMDISKLEPYKNLDFVGDDGEKVYTETKFFTIKNRDKTNLCTITRDITEYINANKKLETQSKELQKLLSEKDKFFGLIAHDLKSPLAGMIGLTYDLTQNFNNYSLHDLNEILHTLYDTSSNLHKLLENLLDWSVMNQGIMTYNPEVIDARESVKEVFSLLSYSAKEKNINLILQIDNIFLYADPKMVHSIFRNFISNAIKFSESGEKIIVRQTFIKDQQVFFEIIDYGQGIKQEVLVELGSSAFTLESSLGTKGEKGSGLGLLLCKKFIDMHKCVLKIHSRQSGTTIIFSLPLSHKN